MAEVEAGRIADAVRAGAKTVRAVARPHSFVAFDRPKSPVADLIDELKRQIPALDSFVLTDEVMAEVQRHAAELIAKIKATGATLSKSPQAIVDRALSLMDHTAAPKDLMIPPPSGELLADDAKTQRAKIKRRPWRRPDNNHGYR
jgi:hypothetical protein